MRAVSLKLKNYAASVNIVDNNNLQERILHMILMSFGVLALLYVCLLGSMVFNIVERRALEANARALSNEVSNLEINYLSMSGKVDLTLAQGLGFKETAIKYATRKSLSSLNSSGSIKIAQNDL